MDIKNVAQSIMPKNANNNSTNNVKGEVAQIASNNTSVNTAEKIKLAMELFKEGQIVKGEVLDVKNLVAKIITSNGELINGKLQSAGQLNIGEERNFLVKQDDSGNTTFSIVKEDPQKLVDNNLSKELAKLGIKTDDKNLDLAKNLIKTELPVNRETMQNLNRALALLGEGEGKLDKALFMMKNEMGVNSKNANMLNQFVSKEVNSLENLKNLENAIKNLDDPKLKSEILKIINGTLEDAKPDQNKQLENVKNQVNSGDIATDGKSELSKNQNLQDLKQVDQKNVDPKNIDFSKESTVLNEKDIKSNVGELLKKEEGLIYKDNALLENAEKNSENQKDLPNEKLNLKFNLKNGDPKELENFLNTTKDKIESAIKEIEKANVPGGEKVLEQLNNAKDRLEFTQFAKNNFYMQLPLNVNNHETNGELMIFKDKNHKNGKKGGATSAIVGIDTVNIGRFETYIKKNNKKVDLQFRLENDYVVNLVKENMDKLGGLLQGYGVDIESVSFKKIENSFTIMSDEEEKNEELKLPNVKFNIRM